MMILYFMKNSKRYHPTWGTHQQQIQNQLNSLRKALDVAKSRGLLNDLIKKYPNIFKVSSMNPPSPATKKPPRICE